MPSRNSAISNKIQTVHSSSDLRELHHYFVKALKKMESAESDDSWDFGSGDLLNCSEIHAITAIGHNPDMNITDLAAFMGLSKSSSSQIISRLAKKNLVRKYRPTGNDKEIRLSLTPRGRIAFLGHEQFHAKFEEQLQQNLGSVSEEDIQKMISLCKAIEKTADWVIETRKKYSPDS